YRTYFRERADILLDGVLDVSNAQARFDSLVVLFEPEIPSHAQRYPGAGLWNLAQAANNYQDFLALRSPVFIDHLAEFLADFMAPVELSHFSATTQTDEVVLHWQTEQERDNTGFEVWRAVADSTALELLATSEQYPGLVGSLHSDDPLQYSFVDADAPVETTLWYQLRHTDTSGETVVHKWLVQAGPAPLPALVINEFLASNNSTNADPAGEFDDWIELYNRSNHNLDLGDYFLTDDLNNPSKWQLPTMTLRGSEHVLIWCDNDMFQEGIHASFNLSASGEQIGLFLNDAGLALPIDTLDFGPQVSDVSYGRVSDGNTNWQFFEQPTPSSANSALSAAPDESPTVLLSAPRISPNPSGGQMEIRFSSGRSGPVTVDVFDTRGYRVRRLFAENLPAGSQAVVWDRRDGDGRLVPAGVYLVKIQAAGTAVTGKIGVVR
ncbi:MAG: hypothetical protein DRQ48_11245, partial [Gammaproteobacteria bacterium]